MELDAVKGCRICLTTDCKLYSMITHKILYLAYEKISGLLINNEEPLYLCPDCTRQLLVCAHIRRIIRDVHSVLVETAKNFGPRTIESLQFAKAKLGFREQLGFQNDDLDLKMIDGQNVYTADQTEIKVLLDEVAAITFIKVEQNDKDDDHNETINHGFNTARCGNDGKVCIDISPENMNVSNMGLDENIVIKQESVDLEDTSNVGGDGGVTWSNEITVSGVKVEKKEGNDQESDDMKSTLNDGAGVVCIEWQDVDTTVNQGKVEKNYVMIQEAVDRESTYASVELKKPLEGENDSSNDSLPLSEAITRAAADSGSELVKKLPEHAGQANNDAQRSTSSGCGYVTNYRLTCELCPFATNNELRWKGHLKAHAAKESFSCELCDYITTTKTRLMGHSEVHKGEKSHSCPVCDRAFHKKHNLEIHVRKHYLVKPYVCDVCDKSFTEKRILENHYRVHSGEKPFACTVCGKAFTNRCSLRKHLYIHSDEKAFKCDVCGKSFISKSYVRIHMRRHSEERPFSCHVCNKPFNRKNHLQEHVLGCHSGDRPYACEICSKKFINAARLRTHVSLHTDVKPFKCNHCEKSFKTKGNAKAHMLRHNKNDKK